MYYKLIVRLLVPILLVNSVKCLEQSVESETESSGLLSFYGLTSTIEYCSAQKDVTKCVQKYIYKILDNAAKLKNDWVLNGFITLKKKENFTKIDDVSDVGKSFNEKMEIKLRNLLNSRSVQLNLLEQSDDEEDIDEGRMRKRKKKKGGRRHKKMMEYGPLAAAVGGIFLISMVTQMFLGQVVFVTTAAVVLSKLAFVLAAVIAVKKLFKKPSNEQIIWPEASKPYGAWSRNLQNSNEIEIDLPYRGHSTASEIESIQS